MISRQLLWILLLTLCLPSCITSQKAVVELKLDSQLDINEKIDQVEIDNLQNIYILTSDDKIIRYDSDLNKKYEYSNGSIGDIVSIDATNPQKILCFIAAFNRILILDNTLAEIKTLDLSTTEFLDVTAVARSNDNRIWIFDPINQVLVKIDNLGNAQFTSNRLSDYNLGNVNPTIIREKENKVVIVDEDLGILIFDNFGQFLKIIPELDVEYIQIFGDYIFYSQKGKFYQYHIKRFVKENIELEGEGFSKFKFTTEYIYLFGKRGLIRKKQ
ncbi:MAG: hypothetical protein ACJA1A_002326 [Saprospiraceae bacterium]|jgi:hypothetical protein